MGTGIAAAVLAAALAACDGGKPDVQPLPPLERPSPEQRAGLPEVAGVWRFAGFEIPARDTAVVRADSAILARPGDLWLQTQRLDSLAGAYVRGDARYPMVGEVRRDGILSLVAYAGDGVGYFAAGRAQRDTVWIELTTIPSLAGWPRGTRAALVRRPAGAPFLRLLGGVAIPVPRDSAFVADSIRADSVARAAAAAAAAPGAAPGAPPAATPGGVVTPPAGPPPARPVVTPPAATPAVPPRTTPDTPDTPVRPTPPRPRPPTPRPDTPRLPVTPPPPPPDTFPTAPPDTIRIR